MYKYYGKDYQKELQWVRKRGIELRGFTLNVYGDVRLGPVLMKLMGYGPKYLNLDLASYYVTRGKLTDLDVIVVEHTALSLACDNGLVEMVKCLLAAGYLNKPESETNTKTTVYSKGLKKEPPWSILSQIRI